MMTLIGNDDYMSFDNDYGNDDDNDNEHDSDDYKHHIIMNMMSIMIMKIYNIYYLWCILKYNTYIIIA